MVDRMLNKYELTQDIDAHLDQCRGFYAVINEAFIYTSIRH